MSSMTLAETTRPLVSSESRSAHPPPRAPRDPALQRRTRSTMPWAAIAVASAGVLSVAPLYLHNVVSDARAEGVERYADGLARLSTASSRRVHGLEQRIERIEVARGDELRRDEAEHPTPQGPQCRVPEASIGFNSPPACSVLEPERSGG
jgi:hypothetical protein